MEVKTIPLLISLFLFALFFCPVPMGILNIGNGFGMAVSAVSALIFLFYGRFSALVSAVSQKTAGKIFLGVTSALIVVFAVFALTVSIFMAKAVNDPPKDENTTLVVLGCKVKDGRPSLMLKRRLDASYNYLSAHESVKVVVSGGQGSDELISEAQCMRDYLVLKGISPERIFMEDKSVNTMENIEFSEKIILKNGLPEKITLITDGFHQLRAEILAKKQGIDPYNISGYTSWYIVPTYWVREWFGTAFYLFFG